MDWIKAMLSAVEEDSRELDEVVSALIEEAIDELGR